MSAISAAMVLAAGLGTRLRPLTADRPKALVPVGDRPALVHVFDRLAGSLAGVQLVVNTHDRAEQVRELAASWAARAGRQVAVSDEPELLGTAGAVHHARAVLGEADVLVHNADIYTDVDACAVARAHAIGGGPATLVVAGCPLGTGTIGLDPEGRVVRIRHERAGVEASSAEFLGIHVIAAELRERLPSRGCLVRDVYVPALLAGARLSTFVHRGRWFDIGSPATYVAANLEWLSTRGARSWVAPGVEMPSGVELREAVVGDGARVDGDGVLERCIVWPGVRATAPLRDVVVTPGGVVATPWAAATPHELT